MERTQTGVRLALAREGSANAATGVPVLDHLLGELARAGRLRVSLEVAPERADEAVAAAGHALGTALAEQLERTDVAGSGWSMVPADEALAAAALERADRPLLASNFDFSDERVGGLGTDVASGFLKELVEAAGLNLHIRLLEGTDPQHVLAAIFKAVGAALGQACRPVPEPRGEEAS
jgi:imidazoleglycerol-phosphate dehydratase